MILDVPFYLMKNPNYCGQYVLKSIFKYFLDKEYDDDYLSKISNKIGTGFTLTIGLACAGIHEGLMVKFLTKNAVLVSDDEIETDISNLYDENDKDKVLKIANKLMNDCKKKGLQLEVKQPKLEELEKELNSNNLIVVIIDYGKIYKIDKQIFHFVLLTGYDEDNVYFHDVGPNKPTNNKKVDKKSFYEAWSAPGTDMDTLIFSKR